MIQIDDTLVIDDADVRFEVSRSSGPGGQHVNKTSSRVTLVFDLDGSLALSDEQKQRIRRRLATRISGEGQLRVTVQRHRSQRMNRDEAVERFVGLVRNALVEQKPRKATRPTKAAKARRVDEKKQRGSIKKTRSVRYDD